jgi:superfamily II DNA or RNA helicase
MPNLVEVEYKQTGKSLNTNFLGMREMQELAFEKRAAQYLLLKAPPASGKSRALMFLGLDKLFNQGLKKVIVAVPERSIGSSFAQTKLTEDGFFTNWEYKDEYNLCTPGSDKGKVGQFKTFLDDGSATIIICTHATFRFAFEQISIEKFNNLVLAIDEFHHVSASEDSKLGESLRAIMNQTNAHIIAMTGTYFRGDTLPVLLPEDEAKFDKVTYNYYQQLNGYKHLKSLGIGYHFYQGKYLSAINEVLDLDKKTIIHIPNVNAAASLKDKYKEVDSIIDLIGEIESQDPQTGVINVKRNDNGEILKIADLVNDNPSERDKIVNYLRNINDIEDIDIIIALGMAKEGFDWVYCEHALTVGHRGSLTEIIQIIGRTTRDSDNKTHAQFTNLISQPDANDADVAEAVNNMLKAITASLLMEQVLAPNFSFRTRRSDDDFNEDEVIKIKGFKEPSSKKVKQILQDDLHDLKASILQDDQMRRAMSGSIEPEVINQSIIPKIIMTKYPDLSKEEVEELRQTVVADSAIKNGEVKTVGDKQFVRMPGKFVNIEGLDMELIDSVNPFQKAYEVMSRNVTPKLLRLIGDTIAMQKIQMTDEEAIILYNKVGDFMKNNNGKEPNVNSHDPLEKRMAEALIFLRNKKRNRQSN